MKVNNADIKGLIAVTRVPQWRIAQVVGMSETTLSRRLTRSEMTDDMKDRIRDAIKIIQTE